MAQVRDYTALLSGSSVAGKTGVGVFVSYSFPTAVPNYIRDSYSADALATFRTFSEAERTAVRKALDAWAAVSGITFFEVAAGDGDLKFSNYDMKLMNPGAAGFASYPDNGGGWDASSDVYIGDGYGTNQHILLHEIGHALGLKHPFDGSTTLATDLDNFASTVMSYNYAGSSGAGDVLGTLDVDAIRAIYGDAGAKGRQVASWSWDAASATLTQTGSDGVDTINGIGGSDLIYGGLGNDTIRVRGGSDRAYGGDGNDMLSGSSGAKLFDGGSGDDQLTGGVADDRLFGGVGNDQVYGGGGFDQVDTGDGTDTIFLNGMIARFAVDGGAGVDTLYLSPTLAAGGSFSVPAMLAAGSTLANVETVQIQVSVAATVTGSEVRDNIFLSNGPDEGFAQGGDDYVVGALGDDRLHGGDGADSLYGGLGNDTIWGDAANDYIDGGGGIDLLYGGAGDDSLRLAIAGSATGFVIDGGDGTDTATVTFDDVSRTITGALLNLVGVERVSVLSGGGADRIEVTGVANVTLDGGAGDDVIVVGAATTGSAYGGAGDDVILAGAATGSVYGGAGADFITAGPAFTFLYGGADADRFMFPDAAASNSRAQDQLEDFQPGIDLVDITALGATNVRIQASGTSGGGAWVYADTATGGFQLYVRTTITLADIVSTGLVLAGTAAADRLVGTAGADRLSGAGGNDVLVGGAGNDALDGGADIDSVAYRGLFRPYAVSTAADVTTVRGGTAEGTDTLTNIEYVSFRDGTLIFDPSSAGAQVMRMYDTVLDRGPDAAGLDYWADQISDGRASLVTVADAFANGAEFRQATGGLGNAAFVDYVYRQALGRAADADGRTYWAGRLDAGLTRGELLVNFSEGTEHRAATAGLVAQGWFDTDDTYQAMALLYDGFTNRRPDADGLVYWSEQIRVGARTLAQVADAFAGSGEFAAATAGMTSGQLVDYMYRNTLDRGADAAGRAYWVDQIDHGLGKGALLLAFSQGAEHAALLSADIVGGIALL